MKRTVAILLALLMVSALCVALVSAKENVEAIDLIPASDSVWEKIDNQGNTVNITYKEDGVEFAGEMKTAADTWPAVKFMYDSPISASIEDYALAFDFTVTGDGASPRGAICFWFDGDTEGAHHLGTDVIHDLFGMENNTDDFAVGHYKAIVKLTDLQNAEDPDWNYNWSSGIVDGSLVINGIEIYACGGGTLTVNKLALVPASEADRIPLWNETESVGEDGNYHYDTAYGFDFDIDYVNGKIVGEDGTLITNEEAYKVCNPNWAISIVLKNLGDGKFEVVREPIVTPGSWDKAGITWDDDTVVMVIHSSTSSKTSAEEHGYDNWQQKVVAMALQVGDTLTASGIDLEAGTSDGGKMHVDVPEGAGGPATIAETITIDGVLDDTGWAEDLWVEAVPGENAGWQGKEPEGDKIGFSYQIRTDEKNLYIAVKTNFALVKAPEGGVANGNGSNLRVWLKTRNDEFYANAYGFFFDSYVKSDGTQGTRPAVNDPIEGKLNNPTDNDNTGYQTVMAEQDGVVVAEMSIPLSEINPGETFLAYITVSNNSGTNQCLFAPALGEVDGTQKHIASGFWSEEYNNKGIELTPTTNALGEITVEPQPPVEPDDTYEEDIVAAMGEAVDNPEFKVKVAADKDEVKPGDTVKVTFTLDEIAAPDGVTLFEFNACFDGSKLELVYDDTDFDSDSAFHPGLNVEEKTINEKGKPKFDSAWESLCSIDAENNTVKIKYMTTDADEAAKSGDIVITLTFNVKADAEGKVGVWVPNGTANDRLVTASDFDFNEYVGSGEYVIVNPAQEDNSEDNSGSGDSSDTSGHNQTSDYTTNLIVLAIVALVAVAGSAIVIKTRR